MPLTNTLRGIVGGDVTIHFLPKAVVFSTIVLLHALFK